MDVNNSNEETRAEWTIVATCDYIRGIFKQLQRPDRGSICLSFKEDTFAEERRLTTWKEKKVQKKLAKSTNKHKPACLKLYNKIEFI